MAVGSQLHFLAILLPGNVSGKALMLQYLLNRGLNGQTSRFEQFGEAVSFLTSTAIETVYIQYSAVGMYVHPRLE